jgi:hypothetical protein
MKKMHLLLALLTGAVALHAAEPDTSSTEESTFTWGGDIRLRSVYLDNIPLPVGIATRGGANGFQRYRTRLWGEYQATEDLKIYARIINEFRTQQEGANSYNPLDEIVIDNLYFDWQATDNWNVRIGRQDLIYGTGKLILDGTPKDGSRTIYFNAIKASYTGFENTTIDFLSMYTTAKDPLAIHSEDRDLVGKGKTSYDGEEVGGGIYLKNNAFEALPFEAYYLIKSGEEAWTNLVTGVQHDANTRHTVGARFMPKFAEDIDGNLELAYQFGEDISAYMVDALVTKRFGGDMKPSLGFGWYHLSGDDASTSTDEGWNPLWARWPQYSELYVYSFDAEGAGRWSNVSMPHVDFTIHPHEKLTTSLLLGYLFAPEADSITGDHNRGFLATLKNSFTLKENLLRTGDKLTGHVLVEALVPGDYYTDSQQDDTALFGRVELSYAF